MEINEKELLKSFGRIVRDLREQKGWTLEETEEHGWPAWQHLQKIETGKKNINLTTLIKLAELFKLKTSTLIELLTHNSRIVKKETITKLFGTKVSCGHFSAVDELDSKPFSLDDNLISHPKDTFFVRVQGDSMFPTLTTNDLVVVDKKIYATNNSIVLINFNGNFSIKRFIQRSKETFFRPDNPIYEDIFPNEEDEYQIWGVVIHIIRSF